MRLTAFIYVKQYFFADRTGVFRMENDKIAEHWNTREKRIGKTITESSDTKEQYR